MTSVVTSPAQVCNYALAKAGFKQRVGSLFDGTLQAKKCLDVYGATRDRMLATGEWDFAQRAVAGVLLKESPTHPANYIVNPWTPAYPQLPWEYEYIYPVDAVQIRGVKRQPVFFPDFDPRFIRFSVSNDDGLVPPQKVILCNVANAIVLYAGQVTDPNEWNPVFLDAVADALAVPLAKVLTDLDHAKMAAAEAQAATVSADMERG